MREENKIKSGAMKVLLIIPFIMGLIGYLPLYNYNISWSIYSALRLYQFNTDLNQINILIEIARWLAPLATAGLIMTIFKSARETLESLIKSMQKNSCVVYGNSVYADHLREQVHKRLVKDNRYFSLKAKNQILMFDHDNEAIDFYNKHLLDLRPSQKVYIHLNNVIRDNLLNKNIQVFNIPENCARIYWRNYPILKKSKAEKSKVIIIGFDEYGQNLLTHGMVQNTFSVDEGVEYHIFGDYRKFKALHYRLDSIEEIYSERENADVVHFYDDFWYKHLELLKEADRVILCDPFNKNIEVLSKLVSLCPVELIHIKADSPSLVETLFGKSSDNCQVIPFGSADEVSSADIIMNEELLTSGKMIHASYLKDNKCNKCSNNGECKKIDSTNMKCDHLTDDSVAFCVEECQTFKEDWNSLNAFTRYSNISQADHIEEKLRLLRLSRDATDYQIHESIRNLTEERKRILSEIEHIRWSKFHILHNWEYCEKTMKNERKHNCLLPFSKLKEEEMKKDFSAYEVIAQILK